MRQKQKQFLVLGLGRFGRSVAKALTDMGHEVMAVDTNSAIVDDVAEEVTQCVQADVTDEEVLRSFDPAGFDAVIVGIGTNVRDSVMVSLLCKEAGATVYAKAMDELHGKLLTKLGVDKVIFPERDMAVRLAKSLSNPGMLDFMELAEGISVAEITVPAGWEGKSLVDLDVRRRYNVSIIAIRRGNKLISSPTADTRLLNGDVLLAMGDPDDISTLQK